MPDPSPLLTFDFSQLYLFATFFSGMFIAGFIKKEIFNDEV